MRAALRRLLPAAALVVAAAGGLLLTQRDAREAGTPAPADAPGPVAEASPPPAAEPAPIDPEPAEAAPAADVAEAPPPTAPEPTTTTLPALGRTWRVHVVVWVRSPQAADTLAGLRQGLVASGLVEDRDWVLDVTELQGDAALLPAVLDGLTHDGTDVAVVLSTPALQSALRRVKRLPVVFALVPDPFGVGAGSADDVHRPNVTGVYTLAPYPEMAELLAQDFPAWKRIGTLYTPADPGSLADRNRFGGALRQHGLALVSVPVRGAADVGRAATELVALRPDAIVQIPDDLTAAGFGQIVAAARAGGLPVFAFLGDAVTEGAALALTLDHRVAGERVAERLAAILKGTSPADIPFGGPGRRSLVVSPLHAASVGLTLPDGVIARADRMVGG
jgi:ABC-type uncharacterized transport system substrate-binding protein